MKKKSTTLDHHYVVQTIKYSWLKLLQVLSAYAPF